MDDVVRADLEKAATALIEVLRSLDMLPETDVGFAIERAIANEPNTAVRQHMARVCIMIAKFLDKGILIAISKSIAQNPEYAVEMLSHRIAAPSGGSMPAINALIEAAGGGSAGGASGSGAGASFAQASRAIGMDVRVADGPGAGGAGAGASGSAAPSSSAPAASFE